MTVGLREHFLRARLERDLRYQREKFAQTAAALDALIDIVDGEQVSRWQRDTGTCEAWNHLFNWQRDYRRRIPDGIDEVWPP